jgi:hypothetical protein
VLLNLSAFASSVAGCLVVPLSPSFLLFIHPTSIVHHDSFSFIRPTSFFPLCLFRLHVVTLADWNALGRLIWLSKKEGKKQQRTTKKARYKKYKKRRRKKESERTQPEISAPIFLINIVVLGKPNLQSGAPTIFVFGKQPTLPYMPLLLSLFKDLDALISLSNTFFWQATPPYLVCPSFLIQAIRIWKANLVSSFRDLVCPDILGSYLVCPSFTFCTPPLHAPPCLCSVRFYLVPTALATCLHPYSTLHLLIDCANPCSKVQSSYSSTNIYSVQVVSFRNRTIQALWLHRWLQVTPVDVVRTSKTLITVFS